MKKSTIWTVGSIAGALIAAPASANTTLVMPDIGCEETSPCQVDGLNFSVMTDASGMASMGRSKPNASLSDVFLTMPLSSIAPELFSAAASGKVIPSAIVSEGDGPMTIELSNVVVSSVAMTSYDNPPLLDIALSFEEITWTYGAGKDSSSATWNNRDGGGK